MRNPDAVGLGLLEGFLDRMRARGVQLLLCGVRADLHQAMKKIGLVERLGESELFLEQPVRQTSTLIAVRHAYGLILDRCPHCSRHDNSGGEKRFYFMV